MDMHQVVKEHTPCLTYLLNFAHYIPSLMMSLLVPKSQDKRNRRPDALFSSNLIYTSNPTPHTISQGYPPPSDNKPPNHSPWKATSPASSPHQRYPRHHHPETTKTKNRAAAPSPPGYGSPEAPPRCRHPRGWESWRSWSRCGWRISSPGRLCSRLLLRRRIFPVGGVSWGVAVCI